MKTEREWPAFTVSKKAAASLAAGHPWVYDNEITQSPDPLPVPGGLADVLSPRGSYLGTADVQSRQPHPAAGHQPQRQRPL